MRRNTRLAGAPAPPPRGHGLDWVHRMKTYIAPDGKNIWGRDWARLSAPVPPNGVWGAFRGASGDALRLCLAQLILKFDQAHSESS
jgi:hypothetical protein